MLIFLGALIIFHFFLMDCRLGDGKADLNVGFWWRMFTVAATLISSRNVGPEHTDDNFYTILSVVLYPIGSV